MKRLNNKQKPSDSDSSLVIGSGAYIKNQFVGIVEFILEIGHVFNFFTYVDCIREKLTKTKRNDATHSNNLLEVTHTNIYSPSTSTFCCNKYFLTFINDFSRYGYMYLISGNKMH